MESHSFKSTPTENLNLDLFRAPKMSEGCVVFLHGGALLLGSRKDLPTEVVSFLNSNGWDVASIDYRVTPSCPVSEIIEDVADGCRFVKRLMTGSKLIVVGYSAGAYLALANGAFGEAVDGICAFAGYGDLSARWYYEPSEFFKAYKNVDYVAEKIQRGDSFPTLEDRIDLYVYLRQKGLWPEHVLGKNKFVTEAQKLSPIPHLSPKFPRTVLVHGSSDSDVPVSASEEMAAALAEHKVPHKLIILPGLDHDLFMQLDNPAVVSAWNDAMSFFGE